jgi:UDP-N-acetylmuramoylalanine--D-glutamate ligase
MMAAITVALAYDINQETIINALASFENQPNRLEYIANINGVEFINDSKATNVEAVYYALGSYDQPIVWIAGGQDKGNDYEQIKQLVEEKVKAMVCLGLDNAKLVEFFSGSVDNISETTTVEEAAEMAFNYAQSSDIVLLSPACASFDLFDNYAQRGEMFKEAVLNLKDKVA